MIHSLIIPNRHMGECLRWCISSIIHSAIQCANDLNHEIIIVSDEDNLAIRFGPRSIRYVILKDFSIPFNKPRFLNAGIEAARGDILTFLDADAIVAQRFMENANRLLEESTLTKLCYRVKNILPEEFSDSNPPWNLFADYDSRPARYEAYGRPHRNLASHRRPMRISPTEPVFGNSQFSIRRDVLGDLRFDESYCGHGFEDIQFNLQIWRAHFDHYRAKIITDKDHALYHIKTKPRPPEEQWEGCKWTSNNWRRYKAEFDAFQQAVVRNGGRV